VNTGIAIALVLVTAQGGYSMNHPLTKKAALEIATQAIAALKSETELVLLEDQIIEKKFGWVFFITTKKYLKTKNPNDLLPGIGPLVVGRADGSTHFLSSSVPPDRAIAEYERQWREHQARNEGKR